MGGLYNRFKKKLTDSACIYAMQRLACDIKATTVRDEVAQHFGIEVTAARIGHLTGTKRWHEVYTVAREKYLTKVGDYQGIELAAQRTRLQAGDKIREKLIRIIDRLEAQLNENAGTALSARSQSSIMKQLKDMMEVYLKVLRLGRDETTKSKGVPEIDKFKKFMTGLENKKPGVADGNKTI